MKLFHFCLIYFSQNPTLFGGEGDEYPLQNKKVQSVLGLLVTISASFDFILKYRHNQNTDVLSCINPCKKSPEAGHFNQYRLKYSNSFHQNGRQMPQRTRQPHF